MDYISSTKTTVALYLDHLQETMTGNFDITTDLKFPSNSALTLQKLWLGKDAYTDGDSDAMYNFIGVSL